MIPSPPVGEGKGEGDYLSVHHYGIVNKLFRIRGEELIPVFILERPYRLLSFL